MNDYDGAHDDGHEIDAALRVVRDDLQATAARCAELLERIDRELRRTRRED